MLQQSQCCKQPVLRLHPPPGLDACVANVVNRKWGRDMVERAVGYARVSTEEQATDGISLAAQLERIKSYCVLNRLDLVEVITEEGVSAAKPLAERPGGRHLLELLRSDGIRHVVALKLDRLFRDAIDCLTVVRDWDRTGIALHLIDQGGQAINTRSAMGKFFLTIMAGVAEMERNLIGERTRVALQHKRRNGEVYGPEPFGYRREGERLVPNPTELRALELMKSLRTQGYSYRQIAYELRRRRVPTKNGGRWEAATVAKILRRTSEALESCGAG